MQPAADDVLPPLRCAFYCVADRRHFIGAVALLNSLRLLGHSEPFIWVDAGLTPDQRAQVADHVTFVTTDCRTPPVYLAPTGPLAYPSQVMVVLDADLIAVRSLAPLIDMAFNGQLVGFVNDPPNDVRFFDEWGQLLNIERRPRRRPYLNAGQFFIPHPLARRLLEPWVAGQRTIEYGRTRYGAAQLDDPFYFADQDVVNALLSSLFTDEEVLRLDHRLAPHFPFAGVEVVDTQRLECRHKDGERPFLLHHTLDKPWLRATPSNAYSKLLTRLLLQPDVVITLKPGQLPLRLRYGVAASIARTTADVQSRSRRLLRRQLGRLGLRSRLASALSSSRSPNA